MEKEEGDTIELPATTHVTGTTRPGFIVTCDLDYLRSELGEVLKRDKRCHAFIENICRSVSRDLDFLPPKDFEQYISDLIESTGPTITTLPLEAMVAYFVTHVKSKLDETWDSLVLEAIALWPGINLDAESGGMNWPPLSAERVERLAKPLVERMKQRIGIGRPGRVLGSGGLFRNTEDFQVALQEVFNGLSAKPTAIQVMDRLRHRPLCQQKTSTATPRSQARTLHNWLQKAGLTNIHNAWRIHLLALKSGK